MDVASRYKESYQLTSKYTKKVAQAFQWIYENMPLNYPKALIVDDGKKFYGDLTKLMEKHDVMIQHGDPSQHRSQGIVERLNRTLADRLSSYQYHKELEDPSKSNREWVSRLQNVVSAPNNEKTRLIGMKLADAMKQTLVEQGFSQPAKLRCVMARVQYWKLSKIFETLQNDSRLLYWHKIWHGNSHCQFKSKTVTIF